METSEEDLHAYVDGQLDVARAATVEAWLAQHPDDADRVHRWRVLNASLRAAYGPVADEPLPPALVTAARGTGRRASPLQRYALAASFAVVGLAVGWFAHGQIKPSLNDALLALPRNAAIAHAVYTPEVRHPVEVGADQEQHLVAWLSKRLGETLRVPALGDAGFTLIGGRLLPGRDGAVAQFMFEGNAGERLTLYVTRRDKGIPETAFRFSREGNLNVFYWVDDRCGYAISGQVDRAVLEHIATLTYRQIEH